MSQTPIKVRISQIVLGLLVLTMVGCFVAGSIADPLAGLILVGAIGGFALVMWSAVTLGEWVNHGDDDATGW